MVVAEVVIRKATSGDIGTLVDYNSAMARETEDRSLEKDRLTNGIAAVFEAPEKGFYLVAEVDGSVVGALLVTYEWSDWRNATFWWIQSVYVHPKWRRMGIYRRMHQWVHDNARSLPDVCGVRLYVHGANQIAQRTYVSLGMARSDYRLLETDFS